jgi:hypothetical protein
MSSTSVVGGNGVSLESLLEDMVDGGSVARWPDPAYTCRQASSYDRRRKGPDQPDWFANNDCSQFDQVLEQDGRKQFVLMDAEGPGAVVRFWLTTSDKKAGRLRIYLDGATTPVIEFPAYDLLSGSLDAGPALATAHPGYSRAGNGGNTLYLPIPYARHCRITWEEADGGDIAGPRFYAINYRTYPAGTKVETFSPAALRAAGATLERVNRALLTPPAITAGKAVTLDATIGPGGHAAVELPDGPAAVREVCVRVSAADAGTLERAARALVLEMTCDGEATVWCPVSDFFGSGYGLNELRSWYRTVAPDGLMTCRWVMPYREGARLALVNLGPATVKVNLEARTGPWVWDARSMHFRSNWHYEADMKTPPFVDWNYIRINGRGVYAGDTLSLFNPVPTWYGEGNEKIWVDGESFPSHIGTGTEDYYNFSWAPKPVFQTPFASEVRIDEAMTQGHNVLTRTRNLDGIPFERSLQFDIELMPWQETRLTYAATTYWYALPGAVSNVRPMPQAATRIFRRITPLIVNMMVSKLLPSAGKLDNLAYPVSMAGLDFKPRSFESFCDLHAELGARAPEDLLVYYACRFECPEPMKIAALLGYDGPVKMWIDGKERFHDPDGVNPALIDKGRAEVDVAAGVHDVLVALGSNCGKAWGIYLRLDRVDDGFTLPRVFTGA